jgi:hypothetical protein
MKSTGAVDQVVLVRTGSSTHAFNNEQRRLALEFTQSGSTLSVRAPAKPTEMPPGHYMLFVLKKNAKAEAGEIRLVPSEAKIVRLS